MQSALPFMDMNAAVLAACLSAFLLTGVAVRAIAPVLRKHRGRLAGSGDAAGAGGCVECRAFGDDERMAAADVGRRGVTAR